MDISTRPDEVRNELEENLYINDFSREHLHTLIMLEDATNSKAIKKSYSYINDLLTRCAHTQFSFFFHIDSLLESFNNEY
jgi:hypothetical protein